MDRPPATFRYYGISLWEEETLYDTLNRSFEVEEVEVPADDPQYVSMAEIGIPAPFGERFFQQFTMESWYKLKGVLKDMKRRRGRKGVKAYLRFAGFSGSDVPLVFPLLARGDRQFEMGIEKLEYLVDIVPLQLKTLPAGTEEILYAYEEATFRWGPAAARVNGVNYFYKNNEWLPPRSV